MEVILKPGKRARKGARFVFGGGILSAEIIDVVEEGNRLVRFFYNGIFEQVLDKAGIIPLPPYITSNIEDYERYQTVYSRYKGSAAAPTAGLHFTQELMDRLKNSGVKFAELTLHVGIGTFRPVKTENIEDHRMHKEHYSISKKACEVINETKSDGGRIICRNNKLPGSRNNLNRCRFCEARRRRNRDFYLSRYRFKAIDGLITNFSSSESTILMLISALPAGKCFVAYKAISMKYRFSVLAMRC